MGRVSTQLLCLPQMLLFNPTDQHAYRISMCQKNQYVPTESVCAKRISMCQQNQYVPTESVKCLQNQYVEASFETAITTPFKYLSKEVCFKGAWKCAAQ